MINKKNIKSVICLLLLYNFINPIRCFARAGGGSGGSSSGGNLHHYSTSDRFSGLTPKEMFLIFILFLITQLIIKKRNYIILFLFKNIKENNAEILINNLKNSDSSYCMNKFEERVREIFYKVQDSWNKMDMDLSKEYVSKNMYDAYKEKIELMKKQHLRNVLDNIILIEAKPLEVKHYIDNSKDTVIFYIKGNMRDYIIDTITDKVVHPKVIENKDFVEYWRFIKKQDIWVLEDIKQVNDLKILNFRNFIE